MNLRHGAVLNFICAALANCFFAGGVYALLSERAGLASPVALGLAALVAVGLQMWIGRRYAKARGRDPSESAELSFVIYSLIGFLLLLKLVYLGLPDLIPEEAYYWQYAQRPALGYLDHPAMVAWGILAGTTIFGDTEFGVRFFTLLCSLVAGGFMASLARDFFGPKVAAASFLLIFLLPYSFVFGFFATPDAPLIASWVGALFYLQRALLRDRRLAWIGFGICMGLGMLSKYSMVLLAPSALLFMFLDKPSRSWFLRPDPYLAIVWALIIFSPVLIWNYQNDWASFAYQTARRMKEEPVFNLDKLIGYSFAIITPWGVLGAIRAFWIQGDWQVGPADEDGSASRRRLFVSLTWLIPFGVFAFSSIDHRTKFSWTGPAWLVVMPVLAAQWRFLPRASLAGIKWIRPAQWRGVLIFLAIAFAGAFHYIAIGLPGVPYRQRSVKPVAWEEFGHQVQSLVTELRGESDKEVYVVSTDRFPMASELAFYRRDGERGLRTTRSAHFYGGNGVMYEHWFPDPPPADILMLFVSFREDAINDPKIVAHVRELGVVKRGQVMKRGKPAGRFYYRTGRGYLRSAD